MSAAAILRVESLEKRFGSVVAASDINLLVQPREVVAIIGTNGAGKTTFVNMVTGWLKPTAGRIIFREQVITGLVPRAVTRLGLCRSFQIPQVFGSRTMLDNIVLAQAIAECSGAALFRDPFTAERVARCEAILASFSIADYARRPVVEIPQGVRKLLDIAMAMAASPSLLLLDEPTSGVSIDEKTGMMRTIMGALGKAGVAVMFVEHDMDIVRAYAPRVLAFFEGQIICDDTPERCFANATVASHIVGEGRATARARQEAAAHA